MNLKNEPKLHGEPFNFGPPANQNHSVGKLVTLMANHWHDIDWEDTSKQYKGPDEAGLLKLNCDKALHHLNWHATWDFEITVRETALWYKRYYTKDTHDMSEFSFSQIELYTLAAKELGLDWTK